MAWYDWCNWETLAEGFKGLGRLLSSESAEQNIISQVTGVDMRSEYDKTLDAWASGFTGRDETSEKVLVANFDKVDVTLEKLNEIKTKKIETAKTEISKELVKIRKIKGIECINNNIQANSADYVFDKIRESIDQIMEKIRSNADSIWTYQHASALDKALGTVGMASGKIVEGVFEVFENVDDAILGSVALIAHAHGTVASWFGADDYANAAFSVRDTLSGIASVNAVHDTMDDLVYSSVGDYSAITEDSLVSSGFKVFGSVMGYTVLSLGGTTIISPGSLTKTVSISGQSFSLMTSRRAVNMTVAGVSGYGSGFSSSLNRGDDFMTAQGKGVVQGTAQAAVVYVVEGTAENWGSIKNLANGNGIKPNTTETALTVPGSEPATGSGPDFSTGTSTGTAGTSTGTGGGTAPSSSVTEQLSNNVDDLLEQVRSGSLSTEEIQQASKELIQELNLAYGAGTIDKPTYYSLAKLVHPDHIMNSSAGTVGEAATGAAGAVSGTESTALSTVTTGTAGEAATGVAGVVSGTESTALSTVTTGTAGEAATGAAGAVSGTESTALSTVASRVSSEISTTAANPAISQVASGGVSSSVTSGTTNGIISKIVTAPSGGVTTSAIEGSTSVAASAPEVSTIYGKDLVYDAKIRLENNQISNPEYVEYNRVVSELEKGNCPDTELQSEFDRLYKKFEYDEYNLDFSEDVALSNRIREYAGTRLTPENTALTPSTSNTSSNSLIVAEENSMNGLVSSAENNGTLGSSIGEHTNLPAVIDESTRGLPAVIDNSTRGLPSVIDNSTRGLPAVIDNSTRGLPAVIDESTRGLPAVIDESTRGLPAVVDQAGKTPPPPIDAVRPGEMLARTLNATGNEIGDRLAQDAINQRNLIEPIKNVSDLNPQDPNVTLLESQDPDITPIDPKPVIPQPDIPDPSGPEPSGPEPTPVDPTPKPTDLHWEEVEIANNKPQPTIIKTEGSITPEEITPPEPSYTPSEPTYSGGETYTGGGETTPPSTSPVEPTVEPTPVEPEPTIVKGNTYTKIPTSTATTVPETTTSSSGNSVIPVLAGIGAAAAAGIGAKAYMAKKKNSDDETEDIEVEGWTEDESNTNGVNIEVDNTNDIEEQGDNYINDNNDGYSAKSNNNGIEELNDDYEENSSLDDFKYNSRSNDELADFSLEGDDNNE